MYLPCFAISQFEGLCLIIDCLCTVYDLIGSQLSRAGLIVSHFGKKNLQGCSPGQAHIIEKRLRQNMRPLVFYQQSSSVNGHNGCQFEKIIHEDKRPFENLL